MEIIELKKYKKIDKIGLKNKDRKKNIVIINQKRMKFCCGRKCLYIRLFQNMANKVKLISRENKYYEEL